MEEFFAGALAEKAANHLSERAVIALHVDGHHFLFRRKKGKNTLTVGEGEADVHFWLPVGALRHLLALAELPGTGIGTMGVAVIEHLFHSDEKRKIRFRVDTGFLGLWSKGYFSVLKAGGPEVASYLGRWGFDSLSRIKDVLRKIRG
jgi:hypothetical protein